MKRIKILLMFLSLLISLSFLLSCSATNTTTNAISSSEPTTITEAVTTTSSPAATLTEIIKTPYTQSSTIIVAKTETSPQSSSIPEQSIISSTREFTDSFPLAFQGIWSTGDQGNPDAKINLDTTLPEGPAQIMVYKIEKFGESEALTIAKKFGLENNPIPFNPAYPGDERSVYSYTDNITALEVYPIGSFYLRDRQNKGSTPITLLREEEYIDLATQYLNSKGIFPDNFVRAKGGVCSTKGYSDESNQSLVTFPLLYMVQFVSTINGLEGYEPSATVTFGYNAKIVQTSKYDPIIEEYKAATLKTPESALNILKSYLSDSSFNPPEAKECTSNWRGFQKLAISKISLRYYSNENTAYLQPVWVFQGDVQLGPNDKNTERFVGSVDAIDHQQP